MNHPAQPLGDEIARTAALGFDYLELTLEPPEARADRVVPELVRRQLSDAGLGVIGHTAYYLPIGDPFPRVRQAATDQLREDLDVLAEVGAECCTVHPWRGVVLSGTEVERLRWQAETYAQLVEHGSQVGVTVMLENLTGFIGDPRLLKRHVFDAVPELKLNLDVAHAGLGVGSNLTPSFLKLLGDRLHHVHVSDNNGREDLHLPVGAGLLPLRELVGQVRAFGYDAGITLEVFSAETRYQQLSAEIVRDWWSAA